jgi:transposase
MKKDIRHVGLDVDSASISVAVAEPAGEVRSLGAIPYSDEAVRKLLKKLGSANELRVCYEAGPHGYRLYWLLTKLGVHCDVVAPTLIPMKAGDRVKTNRRDAEKLARSYRSGDLTPVWVPDEEHEALRDLVRARESAKKDQLRARHRLGKFLLRRGLRAGTGIKAWTKAHRLWVETLHFDHLAVQATYVDYLHEVKHAAERIAQLEAAIDEAIAAAPATIRELVTALQALRGVRQVSAVTIAAEIGPPSRFAHPKQLMGYSGLVASEHSTGLSIRRGAITKTGNAHLRRVMGEAAWAYQHRPSLSVELRRRQQGSSAQVHEIAWKAQQRLCSRFRRLSAKGKLRQKVVIAIARELLGFVWAIGIQVQKESQHPRPRQGRAA